MEEESKIQGQENEETYVTTMQEAQIDIEADDKDQRSQIGGQKHSSFQLGDCPPIELLWSKLVITGQVAVPTQQPDGSTKPTMTDKILLNRVKGVLRPKQFTAIMGPSGSGKTTLMNFLAGRLVSPNLSMTGELYLNGQRIDGVHDYANRIGYVTQDDILLPTMSPLEAFWFTANLKLQMTTNEKRKRINLLVKDLGLTKCAHTRVGNELSRGVSGGERKRVSIGVELLVDPSLLFLDEPTTGLDSSTALQVIDLLTELANSGRTVVSSIHQPSSEIFAKFDKLLLIVRGNIIFQGPSSAAIQFFANQGFPCPKFNNPTDYFMKLMNEEGLILEKFRGKDIKEMAAYTPAQVKKDFSERVDKFVTFYKRSDAYKAILPKESHAVEKSVNKYQTQWVYQFSKIFNRTFVNQLRNPVDTQIKIFQFSVYAILTLIVFLNLGTGLEKVQNTAGLLFFMTTCVCFACMCSTLAVCIKYKQIIVGSEKALYLKERYNYYYSVGAFFWGRSLAELPFQWLYSVLMVTIVYFAVGLSLDPFWKYPTLIVILTSCIWQGTAYGLLVSVIFPNVEIGMAVVPIIGLTFFSSAGYFTTGDTIPKVLYPFKYLNIYKYGFEAGLMNEFQNQNLTCAEELCDPFIMYDVTWDSLWVPVLINVGLGTAVRMFALFGLYWISKPRKMKLQNTEGESI